MERKTLAQQLVSGGKVLPVEFRSAKAETIQWRDKETRKPLSGVTLTFSCESADGAFAVSERVPETFDPKSYVCPFKKGETVALTYTSCQVQSGRTTYYGKLESLTGPKATVEII